MADSKWRKVEGKWHFDKKTEGVPFLQDQAVYDAPLPAAAEDQTHFTANTPAPLDAINSKFLCPISKQRMWDPVTLIGDRTHCTGPLAHGNTGFGLGV